MRGYPLAVTFLIVGIVFTAIVIILAVIKYSLGRI